jgi:hypothetical protein
MTGLPELSQPEARRLAMIAARLQSNHDNEVVVAGRMLVKALDAKGTTISAVVEGAFSPTASRASVGPEPVSPMGHHRRCAAVCLFSAIVWNEKEQPFLRDMAARRNAPTDRQREWLQSLYRRAQAQRSAA